MRALIDEGRSRTGGIRGVLPVREDDALLKPRAEVKKEVMSCPSSILHLLGLPQRQLPLGSPWRQRPLGSPQKLRPLGLPWRQSPLGDPPRSLLLLAVLLRSHLNANRRRENGTSFGCVYSWSIPSLTFRGRWPMSLRLFKPYPHKLPETLDASSCNWST